MIPAHVLPQPKSIRLFLAEWENDSKRNSNGGFSGVNPVLEMSQKIVDFNQAHFHPGVDAEIETSANGAGQCGWRNAGSRIARTADVRSANQSLPKGSPPALIAIGESRPEQIRKQ